MTLCNLEQSESGNDIFLSISRGLYFILAVCTQSIHIYI